ncbi:MAG: D-alanine--D-alanine ligase [Candidatus Eremiobacteraeota bacterium]|nr:D-alanine--D-alanine ligase [Candidatus Eremiobacteraeota bacterium]
MPSLKVAVVMGGPSAEREVSIESGTCVMRALTALGHDARSLDFDERFVDAIREIAPDVVFNALHGRGGEDGTIQGVLEWMGIPYTGSGVAACAIAMDKHLTKKLLAAEGLPTPAWDTFDLTGGTLPLLPGSLNLPLVAKPRASGSSAGVAIVKTHEAWTKAMIEAAERTPEILAEEFVPGREFSCGVLGEEALPVVEILSSDEFYTYDAKYKPGGSRHLIPAPIDHDLTLRLQTLALSVHRLVGLRDYSRTDFVVTGHGRPMILEVNALPGLTSTSLLPDEASHDGIPYEALIERLLQYAFLRRAQEVA